MRWRTNVETHSNVIPAKAPGRLSARAWIEFREPAPRVPPSTGSEPLSLCALGSRLRGNDASGEGTRVSSTACPLSLLPTPYPYSLSSYTRNTFITSSPKWLITLTAIRPSFGRGNGREVSRYRVAQASSSISARKAVFSAL